MTVSNVAEAAAVLTACQHRGAQWWSWDAQRLRVTPGSWNGMPDDPAPEFTVFEALAIARGLVTIGAVRGMAQLAPA